MFDAHEKHREEDDFQRGRGQRGWPLLHSSGLSEVKKGTLEILYLLYSGYGAPRVDIARLEVLVQNQGELAAMSHACHRVSEAACRGRKHSVTGVVLVSPRPFLGVFEPDKVRCNQEVSGYIL